MRTKILHLIKSSPEVYLFILVLLQGPQDLETRDPQPKSLSEDLFKTFTSWKKFHRTQSGLNPWTSGLSKSARPTYNVLKVKILVTLEYVINTFKYHEPCTDGKISVRINLLFYLYFPGLGSWQLDFKSLIIVIVGF